MRYLLLFALLLLTLSGCTSVNYERIDAEIYYGLKKMAAESRFDPYAAEVNIPRGKAEAIWASTLDNARNVGFNRILIPDKVSGVNDLKGIMEQYAKNSKVGSRWIESASQQLADKGWAVVQSDYSEGGLHHGQYRVPAKMIAVVFIEWWRYYVHDFEITGEVAQQSQPQSSIQSQSPIRVREEQPPMELNNKPETKNADPTERLIKLKKLLEQGLITQQEYDVQKRSILESI